MIEIQLVRRGNFLVPKRFQDLYNLDVLGIQNIPYDRNQAFLKKLRRFSEIDGFTYKTVKGEIEGPTLADRALLTIKRFALGKVA